MSDSTYFARWSANDKGLHSAGAGFVQNIEIFRQSFTVLRDYLQFHCIALHFGEGTLQQHFALMYNTDMVAYILKLAEIMRGNENGSTALGNIGKDKTPYLVLTVAS